MTLFIVPVVEGQPERLQVVEPFRGHRDELVHPNGLVLTDMVGRALVKLRSKAKRDTQARPLVLILIDAESDCPKTLAPRLLEVARKALPGDVPAGTVR